MDLELAGKSVVVTGGSSNIGRAIVLQFAEEGANITIGDIDQEARVVFARSSPAMPSTAPVSPTSCISRDSLQRGVDINFQSRCPHR